MSLRYSRQNFKYAVRRDFTINKYIVMIAVGGTEHSNIVFSVVMINHILQKIEGCNYLSTPYMHAFCGHVLLYYV